MISKIADLSGEINSQVTYNIFGPSFGTDVASAGGNTLLPNHHAHIVITAFLLTAGTFSGAPIIEYKGGEQEINQGIARTSKEGGGYSAAGDPGGLASESEIIAFATARGYDCVKHIGDKFEILYSNNSGNVAITLTDNTGDFDISDTTSYEDGSTAYFEIEVYDSVTGNTTGVLTPNHSTWAPGTKIFDAIDLDTLIGGTNTNWRVNVLLISDSNEHIYATAVNPTIA